MTLYQRMTFKSSTLRNLATRNLVLSSACARPSLIDFQCLHELHVGYRLLSLKVLMDLFKSK